MRAQDLFPELFPQEPKTTTAEVERQKRPENPSPSRRPQPFAASGCKPEPPDVSWLADGLHAAGEKREEVGKQGLIMVRDPQKHRRIAKTLSTMGFSITSPGSTRAAVSALHRQNSCLVIGDVADVMLTFHPHLLVLPMQKRRLIYYVLVGSRLRTLYNLEALTLSANLVVNDNDLPFLDKILLKGFKDYEVLFGPFLEVLRTDIPSFLSFDMKDFA